MYVYMYIGKLDVHQKYTLNQLLFIYIYINIYTYMYTYLYLGYTHFRAETAGRGVLLTVTSGAISADLTRADLTNLMYL